MVMLLCNFIYIFAFTPFPSKALAWRLQLFGGTEHVSPREWAVFGVAKGPQDVTHKDKLHPFTSPQICQELMGCPMTFTAIPSEKALQGSWIMVVRASVVAPTPHSDAATGRALLNSLQGLPWCF